MTETVVPISTAGRFQSEARPRARAARGYALAVVVPTYNEAENVERLLAALDGALAGLHAEILFVDDWSPDGTADRVRTAAAGRTDVRVLRRHGRGGLSSAAIEGMMATMAPVVAVIDGDGQHDERLLPALFRAVADGGADVAVGSRYCRDGSTGDWGAARRRASRLATRLSAIVAGRAMTDPMSGFFAIRRDVVEARLPHLSNRGFKLLFDLVTATPDPLRVAELPYEFRCRTAGASKLSPRVAIDLALVLLGRLPRRSPAARFALFALVGLSGLAVHLWVLDRLLARGWAFAAAQAGAVATAIVSNYTINNLTTFRDRRRRGPARYLGGLATFAAASALGAVANVGVGVAVASGHHRWWVSGLAGAVIGAAWNFAAATLVTWRRR